MLIIHVVIFLALYNAVNTRYSLYYSDIRQGSSVVFDCLYAHAIEDQIDQHVSYFVISQLTPYCRRPDNGEKQEEISDILGERIANKVNFNKLREQGVTAEQLLNWSAPIDIAERYEMDNDGSELFYNCSSSWFGSKCQYQFIYNLTLSFNEIVEASANSRENILLNVSVTTCYRFLTDCDRESRSLCLDWRQICDGKVDCMSGEDEQWCETLEMTECADDQYRCHYGGQCIPRTFAKDSHLSPDCLDSSEEVDGITRYKRVVSNHCGISVIFRCQERINRYPFSFPCGNGQFVPSEAVPTSQKLCLNGQDRQSTVNMLTSLDHIKDIKCQQAFRCSLLSNRSYGVNLSPIIPLSLEYFEGTWDKDCELLSNYCLDKWVLLPSQPVMYGFFQFVYLTNRSINEFKINVAPDFVCFDAQKCPILLSKIMPVKIIDGLTCCNTFDLVELPLREHFYRMNSDFMHISLQCSTTSNEASCANSSYFHCNQSLKCIPYHRVGDGFIDCHHGEDESFSACQLNDSNRFVCESDKTKCLLPVAIGNSRKDCPQEEDERTENVYGLLVRIPFTSICDNLRELGFAEIDGNETSKTNCDWWPCDNPYSHCNGFWDCLNGIDELNCPNNNCSLNEFQCTNDDSHLTYCLPLIYMFHKRNDDCTESEFIRELYFHNGTRNIGEYYYSFNKSKCINEDNICSRHSETANIQEEVCLKNQILNILVDPDSHVFKVDNDKTYLCSLNHEMGGSYNTHNDFFTPSRLGYFPPTTSNTSAPTFSNRNQHKESPPQMDAALAWYCHYGILIVLGDANKTKTCLCPPNYFGSQCQWQSQRISLTIRLRMQGIISSTVTFQLIIMLIDEQGTIAPDYEQITFIPTHQCNTKFNIYLLYPHRPKNSSVNYSIRIDLFDKSPLDYRTSWYLPIPFQFLPVNRIATQLIIPKIRENDLCTLPCGEHGRCMRYTNMNNLFFCRCDPGYSGSFCNITHQCQCSNGSVCLSPSICVCPLDKFGSHCYLNRSICQSKNNPCQHNGFCTPIDDRINLHAFICVCKDGYRGERCQYKSSQIDIHIDETIIATNSSLFIHYITAFGSLAKHERATVLKKIPFGHNTITVYVPQPFNIIFIQIPDGDYYLTILRERYIPLEYIDVQVLPKQRCSPILELLNDTFRSYTYLRRVKYYPLLCRQYSQLMCFYDEYHMCICDSDRYSNCFEFNTTLKLECDSRTLCHDHGRCFQNNETCPTAFICVCDDCYYGKECQFTTKDFIFSLDSILGYHIKPSVSLSRQPLIVKLSIAITTIILIVGFIMGSLSIATFQAKKTREVGCGYYLLASSISSICMVIFLTIKFWLLVLSQMSLVTNKSVFYVNCLAIDIILKLCLALSEWLNACVAIERMFTVMKGVTFNKKKSRVIAKWMIIIVIILMIGTHIHEPLNRQLINDLDGDQERVWCLSDYSSAVTIYNRCIILFHFLAPFSVNLICAILLIIIAARSRYKVDSKQSFKEHFKLQLQQHKHILIAPSVLVLLALPRLIISFTSQCMRSPRNSWLYLIGYFVSFIPSMMTFIVFVLPSQSYKSEFDKTVQRYARRFYTRS